MSPKQRKHKQCDRIIIRIGTPFISEELSDNMMMSNPMLTLQPYQSASTLPLTMG
jgi:hypothetical protein